MKRILLIAALALNLGGCAAFQKLNTALTIGTASIANPITKTRLNQMEAALRLVFSGLDAWYDSCERGLINPTCKQQITDVQVYTLQVKPYLVDLRNFVKSNDQVNAITVFNTIVNLADTIKARAAAGGVTITATVGS